MTKDQIAQSAVEGVAIIPDGTPVVKTSGYPFPGEVRSAFTNTKGDLRYVVEATGQEYAGMLHIFSPQQISPR